MQRPTTVLIFLALFLSVVRGQDDAYQQDQECMDMCAPKYPDNNYIAVFPDWMNACNCYCYGLDSNDDYFFEILNKTDGMGCYPYTYNNDQRPRQCLNNVCQVREEIGDCEANTKDLVSMEVDGCTMTCNGVDDTVTILKEPTSTCTNKDNLWRPAQCNDYGICLTTREYVSVPDDEDRIADEPTAIQVCQSKGNANTTSYPMLYPEYCEFMCYDIEEFQFYGIFAFENGYSCGEDKECIGGVCRADDLIEECDSLTGGEVQDMVPDGCQIQCVGETQMELVDMPLNSTCTKTINAWMQLPGHCSDENICEVDPEYKDYEDWFSKRR